MTVRTVGKKIGLLCRGRICIYRPEQGTDSVLIHGLIFMNGGDD